MKVIKRNGAEVEFDIVKIIAAVTKANAATEEDARMTPVQIQRIAESVELACQGLGRAPTVEEIQDFVEHQIMAHGAFEVAKRYITYRYTRSLVRKSNTTDDKILSLIECNNEEAKQENSNKNPVVNSTQRDYMAGEVSKDITQRLLQVLTGGQSQALKESSVVCAHDLFPSDTMQLEREHVMAFVTELGSHVSHSAILARTMGIPAVVGVGGLVEALRLHEKDTQQADGASPRKEETAHEK